MAAGPRASRLSGCEDADHPRRRDLAASTTPSCSATSPSRPDRQPSGACASAWPVDHSSAAPKAGGQVKASLLGTIKRGDGTAQITYNKHPLYYYVGDTAAGQLNGQGLNAFGAGWDVLSPSGSKIEGGSS
jgi:hypothetical protein